MLLRKLLSVLIPSLAVLAGACVSSPPALAQPAPAQWGYSFVNGQATATYPGNSTVVGSTALSTIAVGSPTSIALGQSGTTPTLIIGTSLYPQNVGGVNGKYDATSNALANAFGAKYGYFGVPARDGITWAETYLPGTDTGSKVVQLYSLSTVGGYGAFFGSRASDNPSASVQNVIGTVNLVVNDNTGVAMRSWGDYNAGYVTAGSAYQNIFGIEDSVINFSGTDGPTVDPFNINPLHLSNNERLDCGDGTVHTFYRCSNALSIVPNGSTFNTGILIGNGAINPVGGYSEAFAMPTNNGITWYSAAAAPAWRFFSNSGNTGFGVNNVILGTDTLDIYMHGGTNHLVAATNSVFTLGVALQLPKSTVAALPTCAAGNEGTIQAVTDANSAVFNAAAAGGGTNHMIAYCNGTGWVVH